MRGSVNRVMNCYCHQVYVFIDVVYCETVVRAQTMQYGILMNAFSLLVRAANLVLLKVLYTKLLSSAAIHTKYYSTTDTYHPKTLRPIILFFPASKASLLPS